MHAPQRPELRSVRGRPLLPFLPRVAGRGLRACRALLRRLSHRAVHRPSYCPSCLVPLSRCLLRTLLVALLRFRGTTVLQRRQSPPRTVQVQLLLSTAGVRGVHRLLYRVVLRVQHLQLLLVLRSTVGGGGKRPQRRWKS